RVYAGYLGAFWYTTDRKSNTRGFEWHYTDFINPLKPDNEPNYPYCDSYITVFKFNDKPYLVEHNAPLKDKEITVMRKFVINEHSRLCKDTKH
ncbi:MAG: hypothetical protein Q4Q13_07635, partial [Vagococcus sp.]|nr:hypothetical protein [Vagococcus sp.]